MTLLKLKNGGSKTNPNEFTLEIEVWVDAVTNSGIQFRSQTRPESIGDDWNFSMGRVYGPQAEIRRKSKPGIPITP